MNNINMNKINNGYKENNITKQSVSRTLDPRHLSFEAMLSQKTKEENKEGLQVSKHASDRVVQRGIHMSTELMISLNNAVDKAREKGAKNTVMIAKEAAFIINVPNNVIVTAVTVEELKDNVFTNIDSAVLI